MKKRKIRHKKKAQAVVAKRRAIDWDGIITVAILIVVSVGSLLMRENAGWFAVALGLYVTLIALPYIDSSRWQPRPFLHGVLAAALAGSLAIKVGATIEQFLLVGIVSFVIGIFGMHWVKHISL